MKKWILFGLIMLACLRIDWRAWPEAQPDEQSIYLIDNGMHISFVFLESQREYAPEKLKSVWPNHARFVQMGWGDRGFYFEAGDWGNLNLSMTAKAILWPSSAVINVQETFANPEDYIQEPYVQKIRLSKNKLEDLLNGISKDIASVKSLGSGPFPDGNFYDANGTYHLFHTCNGWVSKHLRNIGIPSSALFSTHSWAVMRELEWRSANLN